MGIKIKLINYNLCKNNLKVSLKPVSFYKSDIFMYIFFSSRLVRMLYIFLHDYCMYCMFLYYLCKLFQAFYINHLIRILCFTMDHIIVDILSKLLVSNIKLIMYCFRDIEQH